MNHDDPQTPLCPSCESTHIDEQDDIYMFAYVCRMCKAVFDHPVWVDRSKDVNSIVHEDRVQHNIDKH